MKKIARHGSLLLALPSSLAAAAENATISTVGSTLQIIFGLLVVLGVVLLVAWLFKRYAPGIGQNNSVARVIGGVSVGNRERVLVIEIADRWLVVGVAAGQVNRIANLAAAQSTAPEPEAKSQPDFAGWLRTALNKTGKG